MRMLRSTLLLGPVVAAVLAMATPAAPAAGAVRAVAEPGATSYAPRVLQAVSCPSAMFCLGVGIRETNGGLIAEKWNGHSWKLLTVGLPAGYDFAALQSLSCTSAKACVAVGNLQKSSGAMMPAIGRWNGTAWKLTSVAAPRSSSYPALTGVSCVSGTSCVAVGGYQNSHSDEFTFAESWNGTQWRLVSTAALPGYDARLNSVSCWSHSGCAAVGSAQSTSTSEGYAIAELWNGAHWKITKLTAPAPSQYAELRSVSCVSARHCVATGDRVVLSSTGPLRSWALAEAWNGSSWKAATPPAPHVSNGVELLQTVSCTAASFCMAGGQAGAIGYIAGTIYADAWNGKAWRAVKVPVPPGGKGGGDNGGSGFNGIDCLSPRSCIGVGFVRPSVEDGLGGTWNGSTWKLFPSA
jgi:hypothetical protein